MNRSIPPKVHGFGPLHLNRPRIINLHNGIRIYIESGSKAEVNRLSIALPGGIAEQPVCGMSSIAASALIEGSQSFSGADIAARLEYAGAWIGTSVSTHYTSISLSSLNDSFKSLLPILTEIVFHPTFPADACNGIMARTAAKIEVDRRKVSFLADEAIRPIAYGASSPLSATESSEQILAITSDQLRDYHYSRLDTDKIFVFLSGNINSDIEALVAETFSRIASGTNFKLSPFGFSDISESPRKIHVEVPSAQQSAVKLMIPAIGRMDQGFVALRGAVTCLGGYFGSRLMLNIREARGLTYGISASLLGYPERSYISISTQTATDSVDEVCGLILEEIERMKDPASYTSDELTRLSRFLQSGLAAILDTPFSRMDYFKTEIFAETPSDYYDSQEKFARLLNPDNSSTIEAAELLAKAASNNFLTHRRITAIAGE